MLNSDVFSVYAHRMGGNLPPRSSGAQRCLTPLRPLNQAVKRNIERFPEDFMFQLTKGEYEILTNANSKSQIVTARSSENTNDPNLRSQIVTAKEFTKSRTLPYAFTEQGVAMLSSVLRSPLASYSQMMMMTMEVVIRDYHYFQALCH